MLEHMSNNWEPNAVSLCLNGRLFVLEGRVLTKDEKPVAFTYNAEGQFATEVRSDGQKAWTLEPTWHTYQQDAEEEWYHYIRIVPEGELAHDHKYLLLLKTSDGLEYYSFMLLFYHDQGSILTSAWPNHVPLYDKQLSTITIGLSAEVLQFSLDYDKDNRPALRFKGSGEVFYLKDLARFGKTKGSHTTNFGASLMRNVSQSLMESSVSDQGIPYGKQ